MMRLRLSHWAPLFRICGSTFLSACQIFLLICFVSSCKRPESASFKNYSVKPEADQPLKPLPQKRGASEVPETDETEREPLYNLSSFFFPLRGGYFGSAWCACRSIGTSPHIGQDINADPSEEVSVAVWSGSVVEITFSAACGYSLWFEDDFGGVWRYVHLNKPPEEVVEGARIKAGDVIGIHQDYPTSGCGTGAHLHIELREKGQHSARKEGKNCGRGWSDCFYDPRIIKPGSPFDVSSKSPAPGSSAPHSASRLTGSADWSSAHSLTLVPPGCRADLIPQQVGQPPTGLAPAPDAWSVRLSAQSLGFYRIEIDLPEKLTQECAGGRAGPSCIARMQLFTIDRDGGWSLLADRPGLIGRAPSLSSEHRVCTRPGAQDLVVVFEDASGERFFIVRPVVGAD